MKRLVACLVVLFVASCIPVDDFGAYWDKGTVDKAVAGKWVKVKHDDHGVKVAIENDTYKIDSLDKGERGRSDYAPLYARTLTAGKYTFFMATTKENGKVSRDLVRYSLKGDTLQEYDLFDENLAALLKKKHPGAKNLDVPECKGKCMFNSVRIKTLDDEVYRILAEVPDTKEFWAPSDEWKRVK